MLGRRSETLAFRRSKRQGLTMNVTERYHRSDIPCAAASCTRCPRNAEFAKQGIGMLQAPGTILVPDASVVSRYIEVLEQGDNALENIVFCQTVMDALDRRNRTRTMRNVRRIAADTRRRAVVFANEVFSETLEKARGPTAVERDMRAVLRAAQWYKRHLGKETRVLLLTLKDLYMEGDDDDLGGRVEICRMDEFIGRHCPVLKPHFDSVTAATADGDMDITALTPAQYAAARLQAKAHGEFGRHLSSDEIAEGLRSGELVRGKIRIMQRTHGVVERTDGLPSIEVVGRAGLNRACSGDAVVVRLLGHGEAAAQDADGAENDDEEVSDHEDDLADAGDEPGAEQTQAATVRGVVVGVAQRSWRPYVATLQADDSGGARHLAVPVDVNVPKIRIHYLDTSVLESQYFVVAIDTWPADSQYPQGHFVRMLGPVSSLDTQIDAILVERQIATSQKTLRFSEAIMREMPEDSREHPWGPSGADLEGRRDLRDWLVFSIDPKGCVDIDDAMSMRRVDGDGGGFEFGVHIADVAQFIAPGTAADQEARARGTTVYLADRRFNMIPEVLSEHVCSLHENVDRLAVSVVWQLDEDLNVRDVWFGRSVIRSACELSYEQAQAMLDGRSGGLAENLEPRVLESLVELTSAMRVLRQRRMEAGALELASTEIKFGFDEVTSEVTELSTKKSLEVHRVVEEAMVFANAAVARRIHEAFPQSALLRRHRSPTGERFDRLVRAVASRGFAIDCSSNAALARSLQTISRERADDPDLVFLAKSMATLAMQEADYFATSSCEVPAFAHYGLALDFYTHFTSPIRRYADVVVHRQLIEAIAGTHDGVVASQQWVNDTAAGLNERNRQSKLAQRESAELFQSRYVAQKAGHEPLVCDGVVAEIRTNGLIVYVPQLGLRGPVHLRDALKERIKLPLSAITARVADADELVDGCEGFSVEPTSLSIHLPSSRPGERVLSFSTFDHVRVLVRVQDSGRRRPQVYLTIVGRPYSKSSKQPLSAKSKNGSVAGRQQGGGWAEELVADPADAPRCAVASLGADSHFYAVVEKFAALSVLETSCDIQQL